jgi:hypothetical protein
MCLCISSSFSPATPFSDFVLRPSARNSSDSDRRSIESQIMDLQFSINFNYKSRFISLVPDAARVMSQSATDIQLAGWNLIEK